MSDQKQPGESEGTEIRKDDGEGHYLVVGPGLSAEQMADEVMAFFESQERSPTAGDRPASLAETHEHATNALGKLAKAKKREAS